MTNEGGPTDTYHLTGTGIEITYRRSENTLDFAGESVLARDDLETLATVDSDTGLRLTATLLDSSRNGTRIMLTVLLPEVRWTAPPGAEPTAVSGVAIVTRSFANVLDGPPPGLQDHEAVYQLHGTASPVTMVP